MSVTYYYYQDSEIREKIDNLLHKNALIQCNLGTESTTEERDQAKRDWMELAKEIRDLDPKFYRERIMAQHR